MIEIVAPLNVSREAKNRFHRENLIPFLRKIGAPYVIIRRVERGPVFAIYIETDTDADHTFRLLCEVIDSFRLSLSPAESLPAADYEGLWRDVRKIHELGEAEWTPPRMRLVPTIPRTGHYYRAEDVQAFNLFAFRIQPLLDEITLYLDDDRDRREVALAFCLFAVTGDLFRVEGDSRGYLSFKSHVIGFFHHPHEALKHYHKAFAADYERLRPSLESLLASASNAEYASPPGHVEQIMSAWRDELSDLYASLHAARDKRQSSLVGSLRAQWEYRSFRKMSEFHQRAFSRKGRRTLTSRDFGAYRMVVNFVYQLLPTLGISSRKRVHAAYLLVRTIEAGPDFLSLGRR